jgi:GNAT superfamily N-acetyltransferase
MLTSATETQPIKRSPRMVPAGLSFRMAEVSDIPQIIPLTHEFDEISQFKNFGVELSESNSEKYLTMVLENNFTPLLLALIDEKVVGWCMFSYDMSFFKRPIAVLNTIFVTKKYRRTVIGRMLITTAMEIAKDEQACAFYAPVNSGSEHIHSLGNMFSKIGFKMSGYIMSRSL